jgi:hypothetical protein
MKIAQFRFELKDGSPLILTYNLQDNSLTPKWINIVNQRKEENPQPSKIEKFFKGEKFPRDPLELKIANKTPADLPELLNKLNELATELNKYYDVQLPVFTSVDQLDYKILNYLHEEFERYGERHAEMQNRYTEIRPNQDPNVWPGTGFKKEFHQCWLDLNQWIHITENAMQNDDWPSFSCLVQYLPFVEQGAPIDEIDKLFLEKEMQWGHLYLGYNTLGKDYSHAFEDHDDRVVFNEQVKVQKYLSSEVWLNFSKNTSVVPHKNYELEFYKWWQNLDPPMPFPNISEIALGRYYIGVLSFDQTFLDFHPVHDDWLVPDSDLRKDWTLKVFGKIVKATGIKILDV